MSDPADLINQAVETLQAAAIDLPAFSTLDRLVNRLRAEVHARIYNRVLARVTPEHLAILDTLLVRPANSTTTSFNRLKQTPGPATPTTIRLWIDRLDWLAGLIDPDPLVEGVTHTKLRQFAAEAAALEVSELLRVVDQERSRCGTAGRTASFARRIYVSLVNAGSYAAADQLAVCVAAVRALPSSTVRSDDALDVLFCAGVRELQRDPPNPTAALALLRELQAASAVARAVGVFAEFETNLRRERQLEGIAAAKARGVYTGRTAKIDPAAVRRLREQEHLGASVYRLLGKAAA